MVFEHQEGESNTASGFNYLVAAKIVTSLSLEAFSSPYGCIQDFLINIFTYSQLNL